MYPMRKTYLAMIFCLIFITSSAQPGRMNFGRNIRRISALHILYLKGNSNLKEEHLSILVIY